MIDYTHCKDYTEPVYLDNSKYSLNFANEISSSTEPPVFHYVNTSQFLDSTWQNPNQLTIQNCIIDFTVPETMTGPIFMYYRMTNFYQNHRQYIKNYDSSQLDGNIVDSSTLNTNCGPLAFNQESIPYYPCGLIANSMFNGKISQRYTYY